MIFAKNNVYLNSTPAPLTYMTTVNQLIETLGVQPANLAACASLDEEFRVLKKAYFKKVRDGANGIAQKKKECILRYPVGYAYTKVMVPLT